MIRVARRSEKLISAACIQCRDGCVPDLLARLDARPQADLCELPTLVVCQLPILALAVELPENIVQSASGHLDDLRIVEFARLQENWQVKAGLTAFESERQANVLAALIRRNHLDACDLYLEYIHAHHLALSNLKRVSPQATAFATVQHRRKKIKVRPAINTMRLAS
ncbi:hypothetical protein [Bradyrhizobium sp. SZCCHNS2005]|uniref:hypothetical protein n=1 Tax=Bradyrhizobium sp. SZCCHNS2005 TaxID=3057303 RepID=UPI0028EFA1BC|nr:hypothetical protein [Bradyrhizobium sp. SZCCHNS2005]